MLYVGYERLTHGVSSSVALPDDNSSMTPGETKREVG